MDHRRRLSVATACTAVGALAGTAGAGGHALARSVEVPRGGDATFAPSGWHCSNRGSRVECSAGDAYPYVELTGTSRGGVTVKVHTLRDPQGGHLTRGYEKGSPVYVLSAF